MLENHSKTNAKVGDAVPIKGTKQPRLHWPTGTVTKVHTSADGHVRSATGKLPKL